MQNEQLSFYSSGDDKTVLQSLETLDIDFNTLSPDLLFYLLKLSNKADSGLENVSIDSVSGGFNTSITNGGIHRINVSTSNADTTKRSFILKSSPSFSEQQQSMFAVLDRIGERPFIDILSAYPSNNLTQREIFTYKDIVSTVDLQTPKFYLGILNQLTEQA